MIIRKATYQDLSAILAIYKEARNYMREHGNPHQWGDTYPTVSIVEEDISLGRCHVCVEGNEILGVFCFFRGTDPTYAKIYQGQWPNNEPYGVIHRIAVVAHRKGIASQCFAYALSQCAHIRIDTHRDNKPMQNSLAKNGFAYCGIIYLANGDERLAYQKSREGKS